MGSRFISAPSVFCAQSLSGLFGALGQVRPDRDFYISVMKHNIRGWPSDEAEKLFDTNFVVNRDGDMDTSEQYDYDSVPAACSAGWPAA